MSTNASEMSCLFEGFEMVTVLFRSEHSAIVADVLLRHYTMITCKLLKVLFCGDGGVGVKCRLVLNVDVS
jgi:hypothetical protein